MHDESARLPSGRDVSALHLGRVHAGALFRRAAEVEIPLVPTASGISPLRISHLPYKPLNPRHLSPGLTNLYNTLHSRG